MAQDATGTPTAKGIPKFNTAVDAPSGKGSNAQMDFIDSMFDKVPYAPGDTPAEGDSVTYTGGVWTFSAASTPIALIIALGG